MGCWSSAWLGDYLNGHHDSAQMGSEDQHHQLTFSGKTEHPNVGIKLFFTKLGCVLGHLVLFDNSVGGNWDKCHFHLLENEDLFLLLTPLSVQL